MPQRVHFITDADCGYTLTEIRCAPSGDLLYGELHQRPTDEQSHPALPAIAILRTPADLPIVGRRFRPELLSGMVRAPVVYDAGRVEIVWEDPPSGVLSTRLRSRVDAFLSGRTSPEEYADLRESLVRTVSDVVTRMKSHEDLDARGLRGWMSRVDSDLAGVPSQWIVDLADARQVLDEIEGGRSPLALRSREQVTA